MSTDANDDCPHMSDQQEQETWSGIDRLITNYNLIKQRIGYIVRLRVIAERLPKPISEELKEHSLPPTRTAN